MSHVYIIVLNFGAKLSIIIIIIIIIIIGEAERNSN